MYETMSQKNATIMTCTEIRVLSVRLWVSAHEPAALQSRVSVTGVTVCVGVKVQVCHVLVIVSHRLFTGALPNIVVARVWALFIQNC